MTQDLGGSVGKTLDPGLVSPTVAWLAHEDCPVSGEIYSVGGGRVARVFIAVTPGYVKLDGRITLEDVRDHWDEIRNEEGYVVPQNTPEETALFRKYLKQDKPES
jgi:hypothetical protein